MTLAIDDAAAAMISAAVRSATRAWQEGVEQVPQLQPPGAMAIRLNPASAIRQPPLFTRRDACAKGSIVFIVISPWYSRW